MKAFQMLTWNLTKYEKISQALWLRNRELFELLGILVALLWQRFRTFPSLGPRMPSNDQPKRIGYRLIRLYLRHSLSKTEVLTLNALVSSAKIWKYSQYSMSQKFVLCVP